MCYGRRKWGRSGGQRSSEREVALAMRKGSRAPLRVNKYTDELIFNDTTFHLVSAPTDTSKFSQGRIQDVSSRPHGVHPLSGNKAAISAHHLRYSDPRYSPYITYPMAASDRIPFTS